MKFLVFLIALLIIQGCNRESEQMLPNGVNVKLALKDLRLQKKFTEDIAHFYFGAPDEVTRIIAENAINTALVTLMGTRGESLNEKEFWEILKVAALQLAKLDSEEMERGLAYMEQIMDIYSIESSGGRLNEWRYGFQPPSSH